MSHGIIFEDFKVGRFTFRHALDLPLEQKEKVIQALMRSFDNIPETTKCEGALKDPRCGTAHDFPNIALAAFNDKGEVEGAIHLGSINRINGGPILFLIEVHAMPAFPDMTPEEEGDFSVDIALFLLSNTLITRSGERVRIRNIRYAIEDTRLDKRMGVLHDRFKKQTQRFTVGEEDDVTRTGRKLFELKPAPRLG